MKSSKSKMPDAEALKSIIGAMKKLDLDRISGYKDEDDDEGMEDIPVMQIKKKDKDDESED